MNSLLSYASSDDEDSVNDVSAGSAKLDQKSDVGDSDSDFSTSDEEDVVIRPGTYSKSIMQDMKNTLAIDTDSEEEHVVHPGLLSSKGVSRTPMVGQIATITSTRVDEAFFRSNFTKFNNQGSAYNPSSMSANSGLVSGPARLAEAKVIVAVDNDLVNRNKPVQTIHSKKRANTNYDSSSSGFTGSWASLDGEEASKQYATAEDTDERIKKSKPEVVTESESMRVHVDSQFDSLGRSMLRLPSGFRIPELSCRVPEQRSFSWVGHSKGVSNIDLFPHSGHLMLSGSLDGTVKLWSTTGDKPCVQTFEGHSGRSVRRAIFAPNPAQMLSIGHDGYTKMWDLETGKVLLRLKEDGGDPTCIYAEDDTILVGTSGRKVFQFDSRSGELVQTYSDALGSINSITKLPDSNVFITTSNDAKILLYEFGTPVVVKHIQEPDLHAVPTMAVHPSGKYIVGNALNNQVVVFAVKNKLSVNRKKRFAGHLTAGYACGLTFSPCGQYLVSGDGHGRLFYWNFKNGKLVKKVKAHEQVAVDVKWHPAKESIVFSCSWDGSIKMWK